MVHTDYRPHHHIEKQARDARVGGGCSRKLIECGSGGLLREMSVQADPGGPVAPLEKDGDLLETQAQPPSEAPAAAPKKFPNMGTLKIYPSHNGVKRHVPLRESSKSDLHRAVDASDPTRLAELLATDLKLKIDQQNCDGNTALHLACQTSTTGACFGRKDPARITCAKLLIEAGGSALLAETDELIGAEQYVLQSVSDYPTAVSFLRLVGRFQAHAARHHTSPGTTNLSQRTRGGPRLPLTSVVTRASSQRAASRETLHIQHATRGRHTLKVRRRWQPEVLHRRTPAEDKAEPVA